MKADQINIFFILYSQCRVEAMTAALKLSVKIRVKPQLFHDGSPYHIGTSPLTSVKVLS